MGKSLTRRLLTKLIRERKKGESPSPKMRCRLSLSRRVFAGKTNDHQQSYSPLFFVFKLLKHFLEALQALEILVDRGKAYECDLVDSSEFPHDNLANCFTVNFSG